MTFRLWHLCWRRLHQETGSFIQTDSEGCIRTYSWFCVIFGTKKSTENSVWSRHSMRHSGHTYQIYGRICRLHWVVRDIFTSSAKSLLLRTLLHQIFLMSLPCDFRPEGFVRRCSGTGRRHTDFVAYRTSLTEKNLRVPWRGICVAALRLPQQQFHVAYEITDIGGYLTNSSFDTTSCLIIFSSRVYQSFKIQEDSRREVLVFFLAHVSHNLLLSSNSLCEGLLFSENNKRAFLKVYFEQWSEIL